jgi:site-specific DNA recombinase
LGVARQEKDCRARAEREGWTVVETYIDNDLSASPSSKKRRPAFEEMMASAERGELDVIISYSNSRFTRRMKELDRLIDAHERTKVRFVTVVSGDDDLSTADGRMVARIKASVDSAEAERTSERLKRQKADRAARGLPQGGRFRSFGYSRKYEVIPDEAAVVVEIFERRAAGQSATSIAKNLASRGLLTSAGNPWRAAPLGLLLTRPGYAGLREHNGQIVGKTSYPALVPEALWHAANGEAAKSSPGTNARRWLLSGIATCGRCGTAMVGNGASNTYRCNVGRGGCANLTIKVAWLESFVISVLMDRIKTSAPKPVGPVETFDFTALDKRITEIQQGYAAGDLDYATMVPILSQLRAKRKEAQEAAGATQSTAAGGVIPTIHSWLESDLSQRRALLACHVRTIRVHPRSATGKGLKDPERITVIWSDGTTTTPTHELLHKIPQYHVDEARWTVPSGTPLISWKLPVAMFDEDAKTGS